MTNNKFGFDFEFVEKNPGTQSKIKKDTDAVTKSFKELHQTLNDKLNKELQKQSDLLNKQQKELDKTRRQLESYTKQTKNVSDSLKPANDNLKGFTDNLRRSAASVAIIDGPLGGVASRINAFATALNTTTPALVGLGLATAGAFAIFRGATDTARQFGKAMAEVSTLLPDGANVKALSTEVRELSKSFGLDANEQAKASYQVISAGAEDSAEAISTLTQANKLAVGGVTDVFTATSGLTNILNAYQGSAITAQDASDKLFVAMKGGTTTIGELSRSIGNVASIAVESGVSLDELLAATSAITKNGVTTSVAMNGLRAALAAVSKPSVEAQKTAKALGLEFNVAAIKSKGFAEFIDDVKNKTGGSTEAINKLFGGIEAVAPVLTVVGAQSQSFQKILEDMGNSAGATEQAVKKMQAEFDNTINVLGQQFLDLKRNVGENFIGVIGPVLKSFSDNFDVIITSAKSLAVVVAANVIPSLGGKLVSLITSSLNPALGATNLLLNTQIGAYIALQLQMLKAAGAAPVLIASLTTLSGAFAALGIAARGVITLLGGPVGAAITAAYVGYRILSNNVDNVSEATSQYQEALDSLSTYQETANTLSKEAAEKAREEARSRLEAALATNKQTYELAQQDKLNLLKSRNAAEKTSPGSPLIESYNEQLTQLSFVTLEAKTRVDELTGSIGLLDSGFAAITPKDKPDRLSNLLVDPAASEEAEKALKKYVDELTKLRDQTEESVRTFGLSREEAEKSNLAVLKANPLYKQLTATQKAWFDEIERGLTKLEELNQIKELTDEVEKLNDRYQDATDNFGKSTEEINLNRLAAIKASEAYGKLTEAQKKTIDQTERLIQTNAIQKANAEYEKELEERYKQELKNAEELYDKIYSYGADRLVDLSNRGKDAWSDMLKDWENRFKDFLARLAIEKALQSTLGSVSGFAAPSTVSGSGSQGQGSSSITSSLGSAGNLSSLLGGGSSASLVNFGVNNLGLSVGTSIGLSSALGAAGIGAFAGGILQDFLGGNKTGGSIGGGVGAAAGTLLTPILGPFGPILGGLAGSLLGGLFGGKPSSKLQAAEVDLLSGKIGTRSGLTGDKFSQENFDAVTKLSDLTIRLTDIITGGSGLRDSLTVSAGDRNGLEFSFDGKNQAFSTAEGFIEAFTKEIVARADKVSEPLIIALSNIDFSDVEQALSDIEFASAFDSLFEAKTTVTEAEKAFDALKEQMKLISQTTERLGLDLQKVSQLQDQVISDFISGYNQGLDSQIREIVDPVANKLLEENARYVQQLQEAQAIGADTQKVEELHRVKMLQLIEQYNTQEEGSLTLAGKTKKQIQDSLKEAQRLAEAYDSISKTLVDTIADLKISSLSPLTTEQRLGEARSRFNQINALAQSGDELALKELPNAAKELLTISREFNSSNGAYRQDFDAVQNALQRANDVASQQARDARRQIELAETQLTKFDEMISGISGLDATLTDLSKSLIDTFLQGQGASVSASRYKGSGSLNDILSTGITRAQNIAVATSLGYTGDFGTGGHAAFLDSDPTGLRRKQYEAAVVRLGGRFANGGIPHSPGSAYLVGERGMEVLGDTRSMGINPNNKLQITDDSRTVGAIESVGRKMDMFIGEVSNTNRLLAAIASKDDSQAIRDLGRKLKTSRSAWAV